MKQTITTEGSRLSWKNYLKHPLHASLFITSQNWTFSEGEPWNYMNPDFWVWVLPWYYCGADRLQSVRVCACLGSLELLSELHEHDRFERDIRHSPLRVTFDQGKKAGTLKVELY